MAKGSMSIECLLRKSVC